MGSEENPERKKEKEKSFWKDNEERIKVDRKDIWKGFMRINMERKEHRNNTKSKLNYIDNNRVENRT